MKCVALHIKINKASMKTSPIFGKAVTVAVVVAVVG